MAMTCETYNPQKPSEKKFSLLTYTELCRNKAAFFIVLDGEDGRRTASFYCAACAKRGVSETKLVAKQDLLPISIIRRVPGIEQFEVRWDDGTWNPINNPGPYEKSVLDKWAALEGDDDPDDATLDLSFEAQLKDWAAWRKAA